MRRAVLVRMVTAVGIVLALGCHADPDDPAGQAGELTDPVRRQNAVANIQRLYTSALAQAEGDRSAAEVKEIADATVEKLTQAYLDYPEDNQNRMSIIRLLGEMRDPRSLPALVEALDWRPEVSEDQAVEAAKTLAVIDIPEGKKGEVITGLEEAVRKVSGARGVDNRMRIQFIRTLGELGDERATPVLIDVATAQTEEQNFLINRLAAQQLGRIGDPEAVPAMIKGLFLFAPNNPAMRMNDVAAEALVRIGRPSYEPLLLVLKGENEEVNAIVEAYIEAVKQRNPQAAEQMTVRAETTKEATFTLGALGYPEALDEILKEANADDINRRVGAALALVRLNLPANKEGQVRDTLKEIYEAAPPASKPQLIAAMRYTYDAEMLPFLLEQAKDRELHPQVRLAAAEAYALLANESEAAKLEQVIASEPKSEEGGFQENFAEYRPALALAGECGEDLGCYAGKLEEGDKLVVRKAAYMLGRFGEGDQAAIDPLVEQLDHMEIEVRLAALQALDEIATEGSEKAVAKIDELQQTEEGRSIWNQFKREALPIQARLRNRMGS